MRLGERRARQQLLVTGRDGGYPRDLTGEAVFESDDPAVARVGAGGVVRPGRPGATRVVVRAAGRSA